MSTRNEEKVDWTFQTTPPMGGATGEAFVNPLMGAGMKPAGVLAREAIQNSVDAGLPEEKVRVTFRRNHVVGPEKREFVSALMLTREFKEREGVLELQRDHCLSTLHDDSVPLELVFVDDYNTHGLFGDPHDSHSHFFRLLLALGDGSKSREGKSTGGSYGYGKSVYSSSSRIRTIVAYSVFANPHVFDGVRSRLMGCGYFASHELGARRYTGRAWFGVRRAGEAEVVGPLEGSEADAMARRLGFEPRSPSEPGTSILIVDCAVTTEDLRKSVEDWWWPRILDDELGLDVELFEDGERVSPPRPRSRAR